MENRKLLICIIIVALKTIASSAETKVSWQCLVDTGNTRIAQIAVEGDWLAWLTLELDPRTIIHRAQSFYDRLYRKNLKSDKVEILHDPQIPCIGYWSFVLGRNGTVSYHCHARYDQTLYIIVREKPFGFRESLRKLSELEFPPTPYRIMDNFLVCRQYANSGAGYGISAIPLQSGIPCFDETIVVVDPSPMSHKSIEGPIFADDHFVLYLVSSCCGK